MHSVHMYSGFESYYDEEDEDSVFARGDDDNVDLNESELIRLVSENPILYNKKLDGYMNAGKKSQVWTRIGASLREPITDCVRNSERREKKVRDSTPGSGAGAEQPVYIPSWAAYKDLMFLADVIQPRERTATNHKRSSSTGLSQFMPAAKAIRGKGRASLISTVSRSSSPATMMFNPGTSSAFQVPFRVGGNDLPTNSTAGILDTAEMVVSNLDDLDLSMIEVPTTSTDDSQSSVGTSVTAVARGSSAVVPPPDYSYKQRRRDMETINKKIEESSQGITKLAENLGAALEKAASGGVVAAPSTPGHLGNFTPAVQAMLSSLGFALGRVSEDQQLECLIDLLSLVNTKYTKKVP